MTNSEILAKLIKISNKMSDNSISAWKDKLDETGNVIIVEDFNKNLEEEGHPDYEPALDVKYNGWAEDLDVLIKALSIQNEQEVKPEEQEQSTLKTVNRELYNTLNELWNAHIEMGGTMDYPDKYRERISDTMDLIEILYHGEEPDGDRQQELFDKLESGEMEMLTDEQAYDEMFTRLNNTSVTPNN